jgi:hypothetical protein
MYVIAVISDDEGAAIDYLPCFKIVGTRARNMTYRMVLRRPMSARAAPPSFFLVTSAIVFVILYEDS